MTDLKPKEIKSIEPDTLTPCDKLDHITGAYDAWIENAGVDHVDGVDLELIQAWKRDIKEELTRSDGWLPIESLDTDDVVTLTDGEKENKMTDGKEHVERLEWLLHIDRDPVNAWRVIDSLSSVRWLLDEYKILTSKKEDVLIHAVRCAVLDCSDETVREMLELYLNKYDKGER